MTEETKVVEPILNDAGFYKAITTRSKKQATGKKTADGKIQYEHVFDAFIEYWVPTLESVASGMPAPDKWTEQTASDGNKGGETRTYAIPVYDDQQVQYLNDALASAVMSLAKNRFNSPEGEIPVDWSAILEGSAVFTQVYATFRTGIKEYLIARGNTPEQAATIWANFDTKSLPTFSEDYKDILRSVLDHFVAAVEDTTEIDAAIKKAKLLLAKAEPDINMAKGLTL